MMFRKIDKPEVAHNVRSISIIEEENYSRLISVRQLEAMFKYRRTLTLK